mmetsp:Transcript_24661/g.80630  ORF Transcript_24661/g.80630 Transcript_24661/m.80630 type:complete len:240 (-) Transcript_24661:3247-3966(-)
MVTRVVSPIPSVPERGSTLNTSCSTTKFSFLSSSVGGSPRSTQFSISTSTSHRNAIFQSTARSPGFAICRCTTVGADPTGATPKLHATGTSGWSVSAVVRLRLVELRTTSGVVSSAESSRLTALSPSPVQSALLLSPSHCTSVTQRNGKEAVAVAVAVVGGGTSLSFSVLNTMAPPVEEWHANVYAYAQRLVGQSETLIVAKERAETTPCGASTKSSPAGVPSAGCTSSAYARLPSERL